MGTDFDFRRKAVRTLTREIGVYILADLDNVTLYVGQSKDGIRQRVQRHLTSARSDIIANRQIDIWEVAYVWEFPCTDKTQLDPLEAMIFHQHDGNSQLVNGKIPPKPEKQLKLPKPTQTVQVISDVELKEKLSMELRLPRQADHYAAIVGHFLAIKDSSEVSRAMDAHFERLQRYHQVMQKLATSG
jgi:hypothetical protein